MPHAAFDWSRSIAGSGPGRVVNRRFRHHFRGFPLAHAPIAGPFTFSATSLTVDRFGYGAMQLAGPQVWGPPQDVDAAIAVLREAVALGIDHIDTSDFYGPHVTNQLIRRALHPYPEKKLVLVTKIGFVRGADKSWNLARSKNELVSAVHDNLRHLGLDALDIVNLRVGGPHGVDDTPIDEALDTMRALQRDGLVRHVGLSSASAAQVTAAIEAVDLVCVQNLYNLAHREDDALIDRLAARGIAYVPFFPLGGFSPLQSEALDAAARALDATKMQVALAWLLQRAPNILLIPGTSSVAHLRDNLAAAQLALPAEILARLDAIAGRASDAPAPR